MGVHQGRLSVVMWAWSVCYLWGTGCVEGGYILKENGCTEETLITTLEECQTAAAALGIEWNNKEYNGDGIPYGCLHRTNSDNDANFNKKTDAPVVYPRKNMVAICKNRYIVQEDLCSEDTMIPTLEECQSAAFEMGKLFNKQHVSNDIPPGCVYREGDDIVDFHNNFDSTATDYGSKKVGLCRGETWTAPEDPKSYHWIAPGNFFYSQWSGHRNLVCTEDSSTVTVTGTSFGTDIAVTCCNDNSGLRIFPDIGCQKAKTYDEAKAICEGQGGGYRLCTLDEMLSRKTQGAGCQHDARYNWVSDECDGCSVSLDSAAMQSGPGASDHGTITDDGSHASTRSFDDYIPMVAGVGCGVLLIAVIVALLVMLRRRRKDNEHVPESTHSSVGSTSMGSGDAESAKAVIEMQ